MAYENKKKYAIVIDNSGDSSVFRIRYIHTLIWHDSEESIWMAVTMDNNYNKPDVQNARLEYIDDDSMFESIRETQLEVLVKERFQK